jgi:hypothetical protein
MNKHIRLIPALALGMAVLSVPTLATAATTINVVDQAPPCRQGRGCPRVSRGHLRSLFWFRQPPVRKRVTPPTRREQYCKWIWWY